MKTIKLTEAAMLSAFFIVASVLAIGTGIGYSLFLNFAVPIIVALIYNRCGFKYGCLSCITTVLLILFSLGDIAAVLYMLQGIFLGGICAIFINSKNTIYDDLFYASILSCFAIMISDLALTPVVGMSLIEQFQETADSCKEIFLSYGIQSTEITNYVIYLCIAALPIGTVIISYFGVLLIGKKLNELSNDAGQKSVAVKNFIREGGYLRCSEGTIIKGTIFIVIVNILLAYDISIPNNYLNIIFMSSYIIVIYFVLRDCFTLIARTIYKATKSSLAFYGFEIITIILLIKYFIITLMVLIFINIIIEKVTKKEIKIKKC